MIDYSEEEAKIIADCLNGMREDIKKSQEEGPRELPNLGETMATALEKAVKAAEETNKILDELLEKKMKEYNAPITEEWLIENSQSIYGGECFWLKGGPSFPYVLICNRGGEYELVIRLGDERKLSFTGVRYIREVGDLCKFLGIEMYLAMFGYRKADK